MADAVAKLYVQAMYNAGARAGAAVMVDAWVVTVGAEVIASMKEQTQN